MPRAITVRPSSGYQAKRWEETASAYGRTLPAFVELAVDVTIRYLRELERGRREADPVRRRLAERERLESLLRAAKLAAEHVPPYVDNPTLGRRLYVGCNLAEAIRNVEASLAESQR